MANDFQSNLLPGFGQHHSLVRFVNDQAQIGQLLNHARHRGWRNAKPLGKHSCCHLALFTLYLVDGFQVVFNSLGMHFAFPKFKFRYSEIVNQL